MVAAPLIRLDARGAGTGGGHEIPFPHVSLHFEAGVPVLAPALKMPQDREELKRAIREVLSERE